MVCSVKYKTRVESLGRHGNLSLVVVIWDHVVDDMDLLAAYTSIEELRVTPH